jgi:hypothetical protein
MNSFKRNIYKTQSTSIPNNAEFFPFDFMIVRFLYVTPEQGTNLDVMVGYENTNTIFDNDYVGSNQSPNDEKIPNNGTPNQEAYLWWGGDDESITSGIRVEAVVINLKKLLTQNTVTSRYIHIPLRLSWHGAKGNGGVTLNFATYEGGTIITNGTNFTVQDPVNATSINVFNNVVNSVGQATLLNSTLIGTVIYDSLTRQAVLI